VARRPAVRATEAAGHPRLSELSIDPALLCSLAYVARLLFFCVVKFLSALLTVAVLPVV
jgi:hypothetical protein